MNTSRGFTLIELLMVVLVIGILATVGIPQYNDYAIRAKIEEATSSLSAGRVQMEQFFQDNRTYVGGPTPTATASFTYSVTTSPTAYTITATGNGRVNGFVYTINQANVKQTIEAPDDWQKPPVAHPIPAHNCWIRRKAGVC